MARDFKHNNIMSKFINLLIEDLKNETITHNNEKGFYNPLYYESFQSSHLNSRLPKDSLAQKWINEFNDNHQAKQEIKNQTKEIEYQEYHIPNSNIVMCVDNRKHVEVFLGLFWGDLNRMRFFMYRKTFMNTLYHWKTYYYNIVSDWWLKIFHNVTEC